VGPIPVLQTHSSLDPNQTPPGHPWAYDADGQSNRGVSARPGRVIAKLEKPESGLQQLLQGLLAAIAASGVNSR